MATTVAKPRPSSAGPSAAIRTAVAAATCRSGTKVEATMAATLTPRPVRYAW